ncbi:MAG: hypothetical protein FD170_1870 [Bacteroidetes bacterium]|nr:MAG: hypothetical protein FD170_1870 [Bacteroidota bacterium]
MFVDKLPNRSLIWLVGHSLYSALFNKDCVLADYLIFHSNILKIMGISISYIFVFTL